jgi:hypothetical protein
LEWATGVEAARYFVSILVDSSFSQKAYEVFSALTSWTRNSQHKSIVIPGNPGEGRGRPGIQEFQNHPDTRWS